MFVVVYVVVKVNGWSIISVAPSTLCKLFINSGAKKQVSVGSPFSQTPLNSSPSGQGTPPHTHSPRRSSSPVGPPASSSSGILLSGLSTVSLDSPPAPEEVISKYVIKNAQ